MNYLITILLNNMSIIVTRLIHYIVCRGGDDQFQHLLGVLVAD